MQGSVGHCLPDHEGCCSDRCRCCPRHNIATHVSSACNCSCMKHHCCWHFHVYLVLLAVAFQNEKRQAVKCGRSGCCGESLQKALQLISRCSCYWIGVQPTHHGMQHLLPPCSITDAVCQILTDAVHDTVTAELLAASGSLTGGMVVCSLAAPTAMSPCVLACSTASCMTQTMLCTPIARLLAAQCNSARQKTVNTACRPAGCHGAWAIDISHRIHGAEELTHCRCFAVCISTVVAVLQAKGFQPLVYMAKTAQTRDQTSLACGSTILS